MLKEAAKHISIAQRVVRSTPPQGSPVNRPSRSAGKSHWGVTLEAGQSYERSIGGSLTLKVRADDSGKPPNGWYYSLVDPDGHDYIAPVNTPLRFNPLQTPGPGYSLTAQESLNWDREVRFMLNEADCERIAPL